MMFDVMKKSKETSPSNADLLSEYGLSRSVCGKYAECLSKESAVIKLDADVAAVFPTEKAVNDAPRLLAKIIRQSEHSVPPQ